MPPTCWKRYVELTSTPLSRPSSQDPKHQALGSPSRPQQSERRGLLDHANSGGANQDRDLVSSQEMPEQNLELIVVLQAVASPP